jgi:hypothetical protein
MNPTIQTSDYDLPKIDQTVKTIEYLTLWTGGVLAIISVVLLTILAVNQKPGALLKIEIRDIAAVFTAIIVMTTCAYHAMNLKFNLLSNSKKLKLDIDKWNYDIALKNQEKLDKAKSSEDDSQKARKLLTMERCLEWYQMSEKTGKSRTFIKKHKELLNTAKREEFVKVIEDDNNADSRAAIMAVLNYFEILSEGILQEVLDENYLKEIFKTMFLKYLVNLKPYFEVIETRDGESGIFKSFQQVAGRWK